MTRFTELILPLKRLKGANVAASAQGAGRSPCTNVNGQNAVS
jgi:hypothetical protein